MKRTFLFRATAILVLSVSSLCLRSEKMACKINSFINAKAVQIINANDAKEANETKEIKEIKNSGDGLLPYHPLIIKI